MKHKIQDLIILSLVIGLLTLNASAASFSDVSEGDWYSDAVEYVNDAGIMVGDESGCFNPDVPVTRAEMAIVVCRVLEMTLDESEYLPIYLTAENYSDVPETHWANMYINKASFLKIIKGYGDGGFGPSDTVTYEQAVTMLVRAFGAVEDAESLGGYPNGFLSVAKNMGLLSNVRAVTGEKLSRANVAVLLSNYCHISWTENDPSDKGPISAPGDEIGDVTQENEIGNISEKTPTQNDQTDDSSDIGDYQHENQFGSGSETGGSGGGT